ncbi:MAG: hypothetical protein AB8B84_08690 [Granulosicoccus sp.]
MNIFNLYRAKLRRTRSHLTSSKGAKNRLHHNLWLGLTCFLTLSACSTPPSQQDRYTSTGVAVLGVAAKNGLKSNINRNALASDFSKLLDERKVFPVIPASTVRQYLGVERVNDMLNRLAENGRLEGRDIQLLMSAGLPAQRLVLARLEEDYVVNLPARREPVLNRDGKVLADREKKVLATQRVTRVSASLIDLIDGSQLWNRHFRVDPVAEAASTQYLGSSFSGSLAAAFANTMVNGIRVVRYPESPTLTLSMLSLLREISASVPTR